MHDEADIAQEVTERAWAQWSQRQIPNPPAESATQHVSPIDCLECGEEVPIARLLAVPRTRRCTACAEREERP